MEGFCLLARKLTAAEGRALGSEAQRRPLMPPQREICRAIMSGSKLCLKLRDIERQGGGKEHKFFMFPFSQDLISKVSSACIISLFHRDKLRRDPVGGLG